MRKSTILKRLKEIADNWPDDWMLFSQSGTLLVIEIAMGKIIEEIDIPNDGGDNVYRDDEGNEFVDITFK